MLAKKADRHARVEGTEMVRLIDSSWARCAKALDQARIAVDPAIDAKARGRSFRHYRRWSCSISLGSI
jgi:hypothetical protein